MTASASTRVAIFLASILVACSATFANENAKYTKPVIIEFKDPIDPTSFQFFKRKLAKARAAKADLLVILTEWNEFRALDLGKLAKKMAHPRLADLRNIYSAKDARRAGFDAYVGVGR